MELREPKRKRRVHCSLQSPLPIPIESITGIPASLALWKVCTGKYNGDCVVVSSSEEIFRLYYQGFFGKGSLSRSYPDFGKIKKGIPPFIRERQWKRRCVWAEQTRKSCLDVTSKTGESFDYRMSGGTENSRPKNLSHNYQNLDSFESTIGCNQLDTTVQMEEEDVGEQNQLSIKKHAVSLTDVQKHQSEDFDAINCLTENDCKDEGPLLSANDQKYWEEEKMIVVLPDSDDEEENYLANLSPQLKMESFSLNECLHLTLEEAFFLSYGLGCLTVVDLFDKSLSLTKMWQLFCFNQEDFIPKYVVYHYFRTKNWVVKPGVKFGGDFILYKQGPPFYHASYIVRVEVVDGLTKERVKNPRNQEFSWTRLMGLHRLAETAGKDILLCQVVWPEDLPEDILVSPTVLSQFTVREVLIKRWVTAKERERDLEDL